MASTLTDLSVLRENPAVRNLFLLRTATLFGAGTALFAVPVDLYRITGSSVVVGAAEATAGAALLIGFLGGGVLADHGSRGAILRITRTANCVAFLGLAVNAALGDAVWPVFCLLALNGVAAGIGITAITALITTLARREHLHSVGALNLIARRASQIVAPLLGGVLVGAAGAEYAFGTAAVLAIVTFPLLTKAIDRAGPPTSTGSVSPWRSLADAYGFAARQPVVRGVMLAGVVGMLGGGSFVLIPGLVDARFGGEPTTVAAMYAAMAVGTVVGALGLGRLPDVRRPGRLLLGAMVVAFAALAVAGAAPVVAVALVAMSCAGAINAVEETLRFALIQLNTPDDLLGRINRAFAAQGMAGLAVGALVAGVVGEIVGPGQAFLVLNGALLVVSVLTLAALRSLRHATSSGARIP